MYKQTFAVKLSTSSRPYEFNMVTKEQYISQEEVIEYFCICTGYTPAYLNDHLESVFRVVKKFEPLET